MTTENKCGLRGQICENPKMIDGIGLCFCDSIHLNNPYNPKKTDATLTEIINEIRELSSYLKDANNITGKILIPCLNAEEINRPLNEREKHEIFNHFCDLKKVIDKINTFA